MEIIRLQFQGIGPFTEHHTIDFPEVSQGGLFLIEGPTGSGKTTILDAIVFALYGDVAGVDSSKGRIVSTLLDPAREPFVDLVIDSSRGLLRVRRTPDFERPKRLGKGTTTSRATIKLWKLSSPDDPEGEPVSTNVAEASEELRQAIGLTKSQFTQTVILPQGNFATFLRAKPEDRRDVLQDIFGTEFYERFAKKLAELALAHRKDEELARRSVYEVASGFCQVAWYDDALVATEPIPDQVAFDEARDAMDLDALRDGVRRRMVALTEQRAQSRVTADTARTQHEAAVTRLRALETRNRLISEIADLVRQQDVLALAESRVQQEEEQLAAADRAEHVRRPIVTAAQAAAALAQSQEVLDAALVAARSGPDADLVEGEMTIAALASCEAAASLSVGLLSRLVTLEATLGERRAATTRERLELAAAEVRIASGLKDVETARGVVVGLDELLAQRDEVAATLPSLVEALGGALRRSEAAQQAERLAARLDLARAAEAAASTARKDAEYLHDEARNAWLGSLAGELAAELIEGEPCAVCGSESHPAPAARPIGFVGREQVQALADAKDVANQEAEQCRAASDRVADQLSQQVALTDGMSVSDAKAHHAIATQLKDEAEQASKDVKDLRQKIATIAQTAAANERRLHEDAAVLASRTSEVGMSERQIDVDQAEVARESEGYETVRARQLALRVRAETSAHLVAAFGNVEAARAHLDGCGAELEQVLSERGFATTGHAEAAMIANDERSARQASVSAHRNGVAALESRLANPNYVGLQGADLVDSAPAVLDERTSDTAQLEAHRACGVIEQTVNSAAMASSELAGHLETLAKLRDEAGPLLRLANLANAGDGNLHKVTLPTYVLLRRFEEVVDRANVRLDTMTGGRYELRRTDEKEGRSHKLGLGLEVVDHQAGDSARDPKTLSGGETFVASLALALGLADAVTSEAGGIELHTLFVDEGFGSLDPGTLDAVMDQLQALRDGGRSVGVVSHVTEMKQRIAERITVVPRHNGTSTLTCSSDDQSAVG